jgi:hypothetical protein
MAAADSGGESRAASVCAAVWRAGADVKNSYTDILTHPPNTDKIRTMKNFELL